jgi:hypothetical protein
MPKRKSSPAAQDKALSVATPIIERAKQDSKQPRFTDVNPNDFFQSVYRWSVKASEEAPLLSSDTRARSDWLRRFWMSEPYLAGVINSVVSIDRNRAWSLVGGRNQVARFTGVAHNYFAAPGQVSWREGIGTTALSYYTSDVGGVVELGRSVKGGPLAAMYHVDPSRVTLTSSVEFPLKYYPSHTTRKNPARVQLWKPEDYFRVTSLPSTDEALNGIGWCALSRCVELASAMLAVYQHDKEQLGAKAPTGLLLLHGISQTQWDKAMAERTEELEAKEREYYAGVAVLATTGADQIEAKLVALSNLPEGFDMKMFTDLTMYGYALAFGYDPREFWPVSGGALGTARETETQHHKATGKGGMEFALSWQEKFQNELPETLQFEFEQRDDSGRLIKAQVDKAVVDAITAMSAYITPDEGRQLLSEAGIIPPEWTLELDDTEGTDTEDPDDESEDPNTEAPETPEATAPATKKQWLENPYVYAACHRFPNEPIIRYTYVKGREKVRTLFRTGERAIIRQFVVTKPSTFRQYSEDKLTTNAVKDIVNADRQRFNETYANILLSTGDTQDKVEQVQEGFKAMIEKLNAQPTPVVNFTPPDVIVNLPEMNPTINIPAPKVEVKLPEISPVINVAPSPAPDVKVTVQSPTVNVSPEITVKPADVSIQKSSKPKRAKVHTDQNGVVSSIDFE